MSDQVDHVRLLLNERYIIDFPREAARELERLAPDEAARTLLPVPAVAAAPMAAHLLPEQAARILIGLPDAQADRLLAELPVSAATRLLGFLEEDQVQARLDRLDPRVAGELRTLMSYPTDSAGRLMDSSVPAFRVTSTGTDTLERLRRSGMKTARSLFLVDEQQRLVGKVLLSRLVLADPAAPIGELMQPVSARVRSTDPLSEVTDIFERGNVLDIPVVDIEGVFIGAITHEHLAGSIRSDAAADLQTMVGASKDERALSGPLFTVRKRMPWLQINLVTAFLAAAVVGVFEQTIAQVTALAVLLPVVAGQSGNTGAQALAVTMRGLALREITVRQWPRVLRKEVIAGLINGLGIAATCGLGVYLWSGSPGLVAVIMSSMVLAMIAAGFAGALIPVILTRLGQDPATSSSIILTTVTDVAGFFAFLGIASLLMAFL
ncbi:MAG: magnesium transporter [Xanthomonadales bacterium]|nr:magnesium transporter [Xanthomonadales bacterium]